MGYLQLSANDMEDSIVMLEKNYTLSCNREITTFINHFEKDYKLFHSTHSRKPGMP